MLRKYDLTASVDYEYHFIRIVSEAAIEHAKRCKFVDLEIPEMIIRAEPKMIMPTASPVSIVSSTSVDLGSEPIFLNFYL